MKWDFKQDLQQEDSLQLTIVMFKHLSLPYQDLENIKKTVNQHRFGMQILFYETPNDGETKKEDINFP
jgi:hypothetical protein